MTENQVPEQLIRNSHKQIAVWRAETCFFVCGIMAQFAPICFMAIFYESLRWWENSLSKSDFHQVLLSNNYVIGCRLNFSLKSKSSLKSEGGKNCQKQIDLYMMYFLKHFPPGEVLEKTEERLVYG